MVSIATITTATATPQNATFVTVNTADEARWRSKETTTAKPQGGAVAHRTARRLDRVLYRGADDRRCYEDRPTERHGQVPGGYKYVLRPTQASHDAPHDN
jgi:hypothetical protein